MIKLSEARQTEFLVGKPCRRAHLSEALSDAPLPVEASSNCIASIDEDSSLLSLFPVEATGTLRALPITPKPNAFSRDCSRLILLAKLLRDFVPKGPDEGSQAIYCLVSMQKGEPSRRERYDWVR
jgi:hypothetical protein